MQIRRGIVFLLLASLTPTIAFRSPWRPWLLDTPSSSSAFTHLLGGPDNVETFFVDHYTATPLLIRDSARRDRAGWARVHRTLLRGEDVDGLLRRNASFSDAGHLRLNVDVALTRARGGVLQRIATHWGGKADAVDAGMVRAAYRDGFAVTVERLERREVGAARVAQAVEAFWQKEVTASLTFAPPAGRAGESTWGEADEGDRFVVQLDGAQVVDVAFTDEESRPKGYELAEGDVLYIPRGSRARFVPDRNLVSLHVSLRIGQGPALAEAVVAAVQEVASPLLDERLSPDATSTWRGLLAAAARMAAHVTPGLRTPLTVAPAPARLMEETPEEAVRSGIARFAFAAERGGLLRAVAAALADEGGADTALVRWAKELGERARGDTQVLERFERMFGLCLRELRQDSDVPARAVRRLRREEARTARRERPVRVRDGTRALRRHRQSFSVAEPDRPRRSVCRPRKVTRTRTCTASGRLQPRSGHALGRLFASWDK